MYEISISQLFKATTGKQSGPDDLEESRSAMTLLYEPSCRNIRQFNPLSANPTKWSNTLKQCVGKLETVDELFECV